MDIGSLRLSGIRGIWIGLCFCFGLAACGGGGGGDGSSSGGRAAQAVTQPAVTLNPATVSASFVSGTSAQISIVATPTTTLSGIVYVTIIDTEGVLLPAVDIVPNANGTYTVGLRTAATLAPGDYNGSFHVNLCNDQACSRPLDGSPMAVPYSFKVSPRVVTTFSIAPTALSTTYPVGTSVPLQLTATPSQNVNTAIFVKVDDSTGILKPGVTVLANTNGTYTIDLQTSAAIKAGKYTGSFAVRICNDSGCTSEIAGSPLAVPFDIQVAARPASAFTFSPATLTANYYASTSASLLLRVTPQQAIGQPVYFKIEDQNAVLQTGLTVATVSNYYQLSLKSASNLPIGRHTGGFKLSICSDAACSSPITDAPFTVPYDFQVTQPPPPLFLSPQSMTGKFTAGFPYAWRMTATLNSTVTAPLYVSLSDTTNRFQAGVAFTQTTAGAYALMLRATEALAPGHYAGSLVLKVCKDVTCALPVLGSPLSIPYDFTVVALSTLTSWPGVDDWEMYQGNAAHTAFVPVTIDTAAIVPRWSWSAQSVSAGTISAMTVSGGQAFFNINKILYALKEQDRALAWTRDFSALSGLNPPSATNGRVYIATSGHQDTFMWGLSATDGSVLFKTGFSSQWESYLAPTVDSGVVFTNGGYYGGMYAFNGTTGNQLYFTPLQQFDGWTPAVDSSYAYAYVGGQMAGTPAQLNVIDRASGALVASIPDTTYQWMGYTMNSAPVIGAAGSVFAINVGYGQANALLNFDTSANSVKWSIPGRYAGNPAYADGVVYAINYSPYRLEARKESDGSLLWWWTPGVVSETGYVGDVLVTNNLVFVSTNVATYAIDKSTHQVVWSYAKAGRLALSANGVLYIASATRQAGVTDDIVAFDVK